MFCAVAVAKEPLTYISISCLCIQAKFCSSTGGKITYFNANQQSLRNIAEFN
jgi:hypothetical protein